MRWLVKIHLQSLCHNTCVSVCLRENPFIHHLSERLPRFFHLLGSCRDAASTVGGACAPIVWLASKPRPAPRCSPVADSGAGSVKTPLATTRSWVNKILLLYRRRIKLRCFISTNAVEAPPRRRCAACFRT